MCTFLTEAELAAVKKKIDAEKKVESAYLTTNEADSDDEDELDEHNFMLESEGSMFEEIFMLETTIEEEIKKCLDEGMHEDTVPKDVSAFAVTKDKRKTLRSIGQAALGEERAEVNCFQDGGSTETLYTHEG